MMKKIILSTFVISALSGCANSLAGLAVFAASDLSYSEYQFHRNITYVTRILNDCNIKYSYGYDLEPVLFRINMDSTQKVMLADLAFDSASSKDNCDTWASRTNLWKESGNLGLIGGTMKDPKYTEYLTLFTKKNEKDGTAIPY